MRPQYLKSKAEAFDYLLDALDQVLSHRTCNDLVLENNKDTYDMVELAGSLNLNCKSVEEFNIQWTL